MSVNDVEPITLKNESYILDKNEKKDKTLLNGTYTMKQYQNPNPNLKEIVNGFYNEGPIYNGKMIFVEGNILYKANEPHIEGMIDLMIRHSYDTNLPDYLDTSVQTNHEHKNWDKEVIFRFQGKLYILYGRYVFGYDQSYILFMNEQPMKQKNYNDDEDFYDDDHEYENCYGKDVREALLTRDEIVLPCIPYGSSALESLLYDYYSAFAIVDDETGVLDALGIYR